jgi:hypothetical protein
MAVIHGYGHLGLGAFDLWLLVHETHHSGFRSMEPSWLFLVIKTSWLLPVHGDRHGHWLIASPWKPSWLLLGNSGPSVFYTVP